VLPDPHLGDHLADKTMDYAVRAARTVSGRLLGETFGPDRRLALVLDLDGGVGADEQAVAAAGAVLDPGHVGKK